MFSKHDLQHIWLKLFPAEKLVAPVLTSTKNQPIDGEKITLQCDLPNPDVNKFEFFKDGHSLGAANTDKTVTINSVRFSDSGVYTCTAVVDSVTSNSSNLVHISGRWN